MFFGLQRSDRKILRKGTYKPHGMDSHMRNSDGGPGRCFYNRSFFHKAPDRSGPKGPSGQ